MQPATLGAVLLSGSNVIRMGVQLAMLPILARLLGPAEFGLVALAGPFVLFCNMLADAGMSQALARRQQATAELESTVFWLAAGLGLALALFACATAWPLALLLGEPRLTWMVVALSPILLLSGLTAVSNARVIREGRFGVFAGGDLLATAASAAVALVAALHGAGAWSLVAQQLTLWACKSLWVNLSARPHIRRYFDFAEVRDLVRFGLHAVGSNLADFLARNADNLIVGGVLGTAALGYYAMAYQLVRAPDAIISGPFYLYIFTAVARAFHGSRQSAADLAVAAIRLSSAALAPIFAGLAVVAPLAVDVLFGEQWRPAGPVLARLCVAGFGFAQCFLMGAILMGMDRSPLRLRMALVSSAVTLGIVAVCSPLGLQTLSSALGVGVLLVMAVYLQVLSRSLRIPLGRLLLAFAPAGLGVAAFSSVLFAVRPVIAHLADWMQLVLLMAFGAAVYLATLALVARRQLLADARAFSNAQARRRPATA